MEEKVIDIKVEATPSEKKDNKGRYITSYYVTLTYDNGTKKRDRHRKYYQSFKERKEVMEKQKALYEMEYRAKYKVGKEYNDELISNLLDDFLLKVNTPDKKYSTKQQKIDIVRVHLKPIYDGLTVNDIKNHVVNFKYYFEKHLENHDKHLSYFRKRNVWSVNRQFLNYLCENDKITLEVFHKYKPCPYEEPMLVNTVIDENQFEDLIQVAFDVEIEDCFINYMIALFELGTRRGELLGCRFSDIIYSTENKGPYIKITESYHSKRSKHETSDKKLKNKYSKRRIPLSPRAIQVLEKQLEMRKDIMADLGIYDYDEIMKQYIFVDDFSKKEFLPFDDSKLTRRFNKIKDEFENRYGIHLKMHDFRKCFTTISDRMGLRETIAEKITGHAPSSVQRKNYLSITLEDKFKFIREKTKKQKKLW